MIKYFCSSIIFLAFSFQSYAQIQFGAKAGLHSVDLTSEGILLPDDDGQAFELNFLESSYGIHFGLYTRITILGIYLEPAFLLNSTSIDYTLQEFSEDGLLPVIVNEKYHKLDIPLMLGIKGGLIRMFAGPVAHLHIESSSDLIDFTGYEQRFASATYGFQAGLGLDIWKLRVEAVYEGNLSKFGNHIVIDGQTLPFDKSASRILLTAGFRF